MESLEQVLDHVRVAAAGTVPAIALRAETALEELLTNSVMHGARDCVDACVWLGVTASAQALQLRFEDAFPAFDPLTEIWPALQRIGSPLDQRRAGGLGLLMVYRLADQLVYARENGRNCIDLSFLQRDLP